jgi:heme-degrading monooxygenase HmoA
MFVVIWEFHVREGCEAEFERLYGPDGEWSQLFRRGEGWLGTELLHDESSSRRYLTIDRWESAPAYRRFKREFGQSYELLDERCEPLTEAESQIGAFVRPE